MENQEVIIGPSLMGINPANDTAFVEIERSVGHTCYVPLDELIIILTGRAQIAALFSHTDEGEKWFVPSFKNMPRNRHGEQIKEWFCVQKSPSSEYCDLFEVFTISREKMIREFNSSKTNFIGLNRSYAMACKMGEKA